MDNLDSLYGTKAYFTTTGRTFGEELQKALEEAEEEYVCNKVIPAIRQGIEEAMKKLQCPMDIIVKYQPGKELQIDYHRLKLDNEDTAQQEEDNQNVDAENDSEEKKERKQKRKSVGFSVSFADGTMIHRLKGVDTWKDALKKIGLQLIYDNRNRHEAWHTVGNKEVCVVEREETIRESDGASPQDFEDGFFIMTQLSHEQKKKDLESLGAFLPQLGIKFKWDDEEKMVEEETAVCVQENMPPSKGSLIKSRVANSFALEVVKQLYNLDKLESVSHYFVRNQLTAVEKEGDFKLIGMFIRCTQEELEYRNGRSTSTRWFDTPFVVNGETMFLSNQWVDKPFGALRISDLQKMVTTCYHGLLEVKRYNDGSYELKEL